MKYESGLYIYPTLSTSYGYNDNLMSDATNSLKSNFVSFSPQVVGEFVSRGNRYTGLASMNAKSSSIVSLSCDAAMRPPYSAEDTPELTLGARPAEMPFPARSHRSAGSGGR